MLILTRRSGEKIFIGKNKEICITILGRKSSNIKVGIEADQNVPIWREEILDRTKVETTAQEDEPSSNS